MKRKSRFAGSFKRAERRLLIKWIRFAKAHRDSHRLPLFLFILLYIDGFVMIVPSLICLVAAVTISPARWFLFGGIASIAAVLNNITTYFLGRILPSGSLEKLVDALGMSSLWEQAHQAIHDYGPFGAFVGAIIGLPTQMITALVGISDGEVMRSQLGISSSFLQVVLFVLLGHGLKMISISALTRYGWVRLEKRITKDETRLSPSN